MKRVWHIPRFDALAYGHRWAFVAGAAAAMALFALCACGARDWHAPRPSEIFILVAGAVAVGTMCGRAFLALGCEVDRVRVPDAQIARTTSVSLHATLTAFAIASTMTAVSTIGGYFLLQNAPRVVGSILAVVFVAAVSLFASVVHVLCAHPFAMGLDAVTLGRRVIPFRDVRNAHVQKRSSTRERRAQTNGSARRSSSHKHTTTNLCASQPPRASIRAFASLLSTPRRTRWTRKY